MDATNLSLRSVTFGATTAQTGKWGDEAWRITGFDSGGPQDTTIPEFVDRYSDPMPILYLRARTGATSTGSTLAANGIVTLGASTIGSSQYDLHHMLAYTATIGTQSLGVGKKPPKYYAAGAVITPPSYMHGLTDPAPQSPITNSGPNQNLYQYPLQAFAYLRNHALSGGPGPFATPNIARNKDSFILISAGTDRIYGTADDITNFGDVLP